MALTSAIELWKLHLLHDTRVVHFDLVDYLHYLQTMFLKFKRYNFRQVLKFDQAYRAMQLQQEFGWGTHIPDLYETYLSGHNIQLKIVP